MHDKPTAEVIHGVTNPFTRRMQRTWARLFVCGGWIRLHDLAYPAVQTAWHVFV